MHKGDRVKVTRLFREKNGNVSELTGTLVEIISPKYSGTLSAAGKPCRRTHHVRLDQAFANKYEYMTFCPDDIEKVK